MAVSLKNTKSKRKKKECNKCTKELNIHQSFYKIAESSYHFPDGTVNVCKECLKEEWEDNVQGFKRFIDFLRVADLPYMQEVYTQAQSKVAYIRTVRNRVYAHLRFLDSDPLVEQKSQIQINKKQLKELTPEQMEECERFWGKGYDEEDFIWLMNEYEDFERQYDLEGATKTMRTLVTNAILTQLRIRRGIEEGKDTTKDQKSYLELIHAANLKPSQEKADAENETNTYGNWIKKIENEKPIPAPLPEFLDVDGIVKYIKVFFTGAMANSLGEENPFPEEYEEVMKELTVDPNEEF